MSIAAKLQQIAENEQAVYEAGYSKHELDFWGAFQNYGNPKTYNRAFAYPKGSWNEDTYNPQYTFNSTDANRMYAEINLTDTKKPINISSCTALVNGENPTYLMFYGDTSLHTIRELIVSEGTMFHSSMFSDCVSLKNVTITGTIGNSISFLHSPLTKASIESVVNALSDTAAGKTLTLKATAKAAAFTDAEWAALIGTKPNWTISLV